LRPTYSEAAQAKPGPNKIQLKEHFSPINDSLHRRRNETSKSYNYSLLHPVKKC
jgi:hypothetical protein